MNGDPLVLVIAGVVTAFITYTLPPLIKSVFDRRVTAINAESIQETLEAQRWQKQLDYTKDLEAEIKRMRSILIRHGIDPNESGPLDTLPIPTKKSGLRK
jgi:hypothetical protein